MATPAKTYRKNITKSRAGHYRLTLIDRATRHRVTSGYGWNDAAQATAMDEARLAVKLAEELAASKLLRQQRAIEAMTPAQLKSAGLGC